MSFGTLFQFEWLIIELIVLGLCVFELWRTQRDRRRTAQAARDRAATASDREAGKPGV
jgi:hypothetical protein